MSQKAGQNRPIEPGKVMRVPILLVLTDLQANILRHVCNTNNATYKTLMEKIHKDRITILQSLESLIKYRYIEKKKVNPNHEKSKLVFIPTHKGISYAWFNLKDIDIKKIIKVNADDVITQY